jgi:transcriptional regulator with XRE-family HTH domain
VIKTKLREARLNKGWSQEELADLIGMTQCNYSRRENGKKAITNNEWTIIANALKVDKATVYESDRLNQSQNQLPNRPFFTLVDYVSAYVELQNENRFLKEKLKVFEV